MDEEEAFWHKSNVQSFSFDEDERVSLYLVYSSENLMNKLFF